MAYLSLYRKHRPRTFAEVVGQEHVTRTLVNAIAEDRLHHAYLFTGQRGTGKTSTARILAAAVNCEQGPTPDPCGECEQCTSIVAGRNVDVVELDMASHGGVDDARELRDRAVFAPAAARKKVYILDEVHMASTAAFNALLKVVEEPPSHVLFAMATTDPQKVLPTILSRVQRLDLRRVPAAELTAHLRHLGDLEGFTLDDAAAAGVVAAGDGSVRDTLSVLEQVLAYAADAEGREDGVLGVTGEHVTRVLGATPFALVVEVVDAIADADVAAALTAVQGLLDGGHDLRRFTLDLARHLRDLLVLAAAPNATGLVDATAERQERLAEQARRFGTDSLLRAVELVGEVLVEQRQGPPRLPLELAVARLATPGADGDLQALADRVARLETAVAGGGAVAAPASTPAPTGAGAAAGAAPPATAAPEEAPSEEASSDGTASDGTAASGATPEDPPAADTVDAPGGDGTRTDEAPVDGAPTDEGAHPVLVDEAPAEEAPAEEAPAEAAPVDGGPADEEPAGLEEAASSTGAADEPTADAPEPVTAAVDGTPTELADDAGDGGDGGEEGDAPDPADGATDSDEDLRARAAARARDSGPLAPPQDLSNRPGTTTVERELPPERPGAGELSTVTDRWDQILDLVGDESRRAKAFYEPATPTRLGDGILVLSYPASRRFHAEQGKAGDMAAHLAAAITRATGLDRVRVDVRIDDDGPRTPQPPPVTRSGPPDDGPTEDEVVAVAESEESGEPAPTDPGELEALLRDQLGAERLEDDEA